MSEIKGQGRFSPIKALRRTLSRSPIKSPSRLSPSRSRLRRMKSGLNLRVINQKGAEVDTIGQTQLEVDGGNVHAAQLNTISHTRLDVDGNVNNVNVKGAQLDSNSHTQLDGDGDGNVNGYGYDDVGIHDDSDSDGNETENENDTEPESEPEPEPDNGRVETFNLKPKTKIMTNGVDINFHIDSPNFVSPTPESWIEVKYFADPSSRLNLSTNPGDRSLHCAETTACSMANYVAEIDRRVVGKTAMRDFAYSKHSPLHGQAYGHADGQR